MPLASWGLGSDNAIDATIGVPGIATALAHCLEYEPEEGVLPMAGVTSVFGRVGAVVAQLNDYVASLVGNDSSVPGATVADALEALLAQIPAWPGTSKALVLGGPIPPTGGALVNTGAFVAPPAGAWQGYQVLCALIGRTQVTDVCATIIGQGQIGFTAAPGTPDLRLAPGAAIQSFAPAVPAWFVGVLTCLASGELLIGVGNNDAVNAGTFALLTVVSGPVALP